MKRLTPGLMFRRPGKNASKAVVFGVAMLLIGLTIGPVLAGDPGVGAVQFRGIGPGRVYMQHNDDPFSQTCLNLSVPHDGEDGMTQTLTLARQAHLFVTFSFFFGGLELDEEGVVMLILDNNPDGNTTPAWGFPGTGTVNPGTGGTVTWSFANVPAGTHTVATHARVALGGDGLGGLSSCALTVMTILPT